MREPRRADSQSDPLAAQGSSPEELVRELRTKARAAATKALREGLEDIDDRYGMHVAEEVVGLIDIADVFAGLIDEHQDSGDQDSSGGDEPFEFKSRYIV